MSEFNDATLTLTQMKHEIRDVIIPTASAALFIGPPGAGKTSVGLEIARSLMSGTFGACYYNCSNAISPDITGLYKPTDGPLTSYGVPLLFQPKPDLGLNGAFPVLNDPEANPYAPDFNWASLRPYPNGIAVLDEMGKAEELVIAKLAQFCNEGSTGQWGVPNDGWAKICFTNSQADGSGDNELPMHTVDRLSIYRVTTSYEDVVNHWRDIGMHEDFIGFASKNGDLIFTQNVPSTRIKYCTARSYTMAWRLCMSYIINGLGLDDLNEEARAAHVAKGGNPKDIPPNPGELGFGDDVNDPLAAEIMHGFTTTLAARCGTAVALAFKDYLQHRHQKPTVEEILANPATARLPDHPGIMHATMEMIVQNIPFEKHDAAFAYVRRMAKAYQTDFCAKFQAQYGARAQNLIEFHKLISSCGAAARMTIYS